MRKRKFTDVLTYTAMILIGAAVCAIAEYGVMLYMAR